MNIIRNIISRLSKPTRIIWFFYIISVIILVSYEMVVDSYIESNHITYSVVDKSDGQIQSQVSKHYRNYSIVYYVRVKYDNGGFRSISMEDPFIYKSYQIGTKYTVIDPEISDYRQAGIITPWYISELLNILAVMGVVIIGFIGGVIILLATTYEAVTSKMFWELTT